MPPPEPRHPEPPPPTQQHPTPQQPEGPPGRRRPGEPRSGRQRPGPTSALAPSPTPLMPVPDPTDPPDGKPPGSTRAGRRQHHRPAGTLPGSSSEELVYLSGRVPRGLRDELHIRAIGEGRPVVDLLRDAIRGYLDHTTTRPR